MQNLNDILAFVAVAEHDGFTAAARSLNRPKSSISRQVERLETRLGIRLLERSTRRVRLTEIGSDYYARCRTALADLDTAERQVVLQRADPSGIVRVTCPTGIARGIMAHILPDFMARFPAIGVQLQITNRPVDPLAEKVDVVLRARVQAPDESLTMRKLRPSRLILVASPDFAEAHVRADDPAALAAVPFLSFQEQTERPTWTLRGPEGASRTLTFDPVLWTSEFDVLIAAACAGRGVALLPAEIVSDALRGTRLVQLFPDWDADEVLLHLVFPTRRGLRPAVRVLIDHIVARAGLEIDEPWPAAIAAKGQGDRATG